MWISTPEGVVLPVKLTPNAGRDEIVGWENDVLKVRVSVVPEKGKANDRLIKLLSKALRIPKSNISIMQGEKNRQKTLLIKGNAEAIGEQLNAYRSTQ